MSEEDDISRQLKSIKWASAAGAAAQVDLALQARKQTDLLANMLEAHERRTASERQRRSDVGEARRMLVKIEGLCSHLETLTSDQRGRTANARHFAELGLLLRQLDSSVFDELADLRVWQEVQRRVLVISTLCKNEGRATCEQQAQAAADAITGLVNAALRLQPPHEVHIHSQRVSLDELDKANRALDSWEESLPNSIRKAIDAARNAIEAGAVVSDENASKVELNDAFPTVPHELQPLLKPILASAHAQLSDSDLTDIAVRMAEFPHQQLLPYNEALTGIRVVARDIALACKQDDKAAAVAAVKSIASYVARIDPNSVDEYKTALREYERRWSMGNRILKPLVITFGMCCFALIVVVMIRGTASRSAVNNANKEALRAPSQTSSANNDVNESNLVAFDHSTADAARSESIQRPQLESVKAKSLSTRYGNFAVKDGELTYNGRPVRDRSNITISGDSVDFEMGISDGDTDVILVHTNCAGSTCSDYGDTRFLFVTNAGVSATQGFGYGRPVVSVTKAVSSMTIDYGEFGKAVYNDRRVEIAPTLVH